MQYITSTAIYHQSNELAVKYIQIVKSLLLKAKQRGKNPHIFMIMYRNTLITKSLWLPVKHGRQARLDLTLSDAAKMKVCQAAHD